MKLSCTNKYIFLFFIYLIDGLLSNTSKYAKQERIIVDRPAGIAQVKPAK